jgi:hypothetical protein
MRMRRFLGYVVPLLAAIVACGGIDTSTGGIVSPNGTNVAAVVVDAGPKGASGRQVGYVNGLFTTVTVCVPGTNTCQDIDHVLVDTGSAGLRLLASDGVAGGELSLALPPQQNASGNPIAECTQFLDGFTWGPIVLADVQLAGEKATRVPIQVISEKTYSVPSSCSSVGVDESTLEGPTGLMTNGILGVGLFRQDCGGACAVDPSAGNPGLYYACSSPTSCSVTAVATSAQVANPVSMFPVDNNGVIVQLPSVPSAGAPSVAGSLIFGIDTQSNNQLGSATVLPADNNNGTIVAVFPANGTSYRGSFIDSGSNGIFFLSSSSSGMPTCSGANGMQGFYCPSSTMSFTAANEGANGSPVAPFNFSIANASSLFSGNNFAFGDLGGPAFTGSGHSVGFDWGLSFFFGRGVYTAIEGSITSHGTGPYFAY